MESLRELWELAQDLWATGDRWGRIFICITLGLPVLFCILAMFVSNTGVKSSVAFSGLLTLFVLGAWKSPMFVVLVSAFSTKGRSFFQWLLTILGIEIAISVGFAVLNFTKAPGLAPLALLTLAGIVTLATGRVKIKKASGLLWIVLIGVIVAVLYAGKEHKDKEEPPAKDPPATHQQQSVPQDSYVDMNGFVVKRECTPENLVPRKETPTYIKKVPDLPIINMVIHCRETDTITTVDPGEEVVLRHKDFGPLREKENRCSFNFCGDSIPVGGEVGSRTRERFMNDLAFPQFPFGVMVFYIRGADGNPVDAGYISRPGGILYLTNRSEEQGTLFSRYNIMNVYLEDPKYNIQVGWDGSTVTHEVVRRPKALR